MSDKKIQLRIVTPDKTVTDAPVIAIGAMGVEGAFTALPGHVPFLTSLKPGLLWYRMSDGGTRELAVSGGFVEILPDRASVLADSAEYVEEIDVARAESARARAEKRLEDSRVRAKEMNAQDKPIDIMRAEISLAKATNRLKQARQRLRTPGGGVSNN